MNYIISQYLVFEKNDQGGILPETRWSRRTRLYNEGRAEALSNWKEYDNDTRALTQLNNALQNNGQTITDNAERQKIADKTLKNASERAKEYGNQIVANTKTLSDFKKENEVEDPNKQVKPKFTDGLKSFASSALSSIGNAVVSAGTAMIAQQLISWGLQGIDAIVHWNDNIIAKGKEAKETILEQNQTYKDQKSQLEELQEQYTKYASGVKISGNIIKNATLSDEDFQAFLDTSNQIANLAPSMIDGWDSEGNAILKFGTDTKEANQQISDYIQLQRDVTHLSIRDNLQDEYKGVVKDAEKTGKEISNKKDQKKEADTITSGWTALKNATETDGPITFTTTAPQKEVEELLDKYKVTSLITSDVNGDTYTVDMSELSAADKNALKTSLVEFKLESTFDDTLLYTNTDVVIFYRNGTFAHTGLVTKVEGDKFYTIEGNTSGGSSIVPNGGGVYAKSYYNSNLPGTKFCRPDYSIVTSILTSNTSSTSSPAPVQPSYTAWVGSCTANGTDVFSGATGASKLSTYPKLNAGNLVDIIGESGTRYQVRIAAKYIGYVEKSNIKNPNTPAATTTKKYPFVGKVTASKLNVRKKPGTEHPLLPEYPMLNKDNLINVLGVTKDTKGDRWYKVSITKKEYVGYVSAKYIIKA